MNELVRQKYLQELQKEIFIHNSIKGVTNKKPKKVIYDNQDEIHNAVIEFIKSGLPKEVTEAYLFGSAVEKRFGKYEESYDSREGSDIDLIVFIPKNKIPPHWKDLKTSKGWWSLYRGEEITLNNTIHCTDILIVNEGHEEFAKRRIQEKGLKTERLR